MSEVRNLAKRNKTISASLKPSGLFQRRPTFNITIGNASGNVTAIFTFLPTDDEHGDHPVGELHYEFTYTVGHTLLCEPQVTYFMPRRFQGYCSEGKDQQSLEIFWEKHLIAMMGYSPVEVSSLKTDPIVLLPFQPFDDGNTTPRVSLRSDAEEAVDHFFTAFKNCQIDWYDLDPILSDKDTLVDSDVDSNCESCI